MNKQEALKKLEGISRPGCTRWVAYDDVKELIEQIDEPEKPVVPQAVADWIEKCKTFKNFVVSLSFALNPSTWEANRLSDECIEWLADAENQDIFARAWLDGYEVEKEKRYTAKLKIITNGGNNYLNKHSDTERFTLSNLYTASGAYQTSFTQSELKKLNVWDNPAFEIEKVK